MSEEKLKWQEAVLFLKDRGITTVKVHYEGSGDSGSIDSISYYKGEDEHNINDLDISDDMHQKLINLCYPMLDNIEDWYNNDGGYGTVTIDLDTLHYDIANNIRYVDYEKYTHEGSIHDLSEE
jgi:hypothetical protein